MGIGRNASSLLFFALIAVCALWEPAVRLQILPLLMLAAAAVASLEATRLLAAAGSPPWRPGVLVLTLLLACDGWLFGFGHAGLIAIAAVIVTLAWAITRPIEGAASAAGASLLATLWVGFGFGAMLALWGWDGGGAIPRGGRFLILFLLPAAMFQDVGAMWAGAAFGRRKLAPTLSPNKTVEGSVGGLLGSVLTGLVVWGIYALVGNARDDLPLGDLLTWWDALALGVLFGSVGQIGDLAESLLKRGAGVKDSGVSGTEHGGVLDVADSLLFCAPVMLLWAWGRGLWMFSGA
jgi:phosphatidate cytidylyltransferase